jgi:hypothetical protein
MPDRQDDLNPASDLAPFADALKRLAPQPAHLSRDALLFEAGKAAAAPRLAPWVWPSATGTFAAVSLVLAAFLIAPEAPGSSEPQVVYVYPPPPDPGAASGNRGDRITPSSPEPERQQVAKASPEPSEAARLLRQKRDVLRWGVDMLPESKSPGGGPSADVTAREVTHWLNLPPGTFAVNPTAPKKPAPKDEDDE